MYFARIPPLGKFLQLPNNNKSYRHGGLTGFRKACKVVNHNKLSA